MGLFEAINTIRIIMAVHVKGLFSSYNFLFNKLIACVKDEDGNLSTLARALALWSHVPF